MNEQNTERTETGLGLATVNRSGEVASSAMASKFRAVIESRYVMAYNRPRNELAARTKILDACKRPLFAETARYSKPVGGGKTAKGWSIRFAEEALRAWGNVSSEATTIWDDAEKRIVHISVTDLESNSTFGEEITISKVVERKSLKPEQQPISKRVNSAGEITYLVEATEDDVANKVNANKSKVIRNCGLRHLPSDFLEEAYAQYLTTMRDGGSDPKASLKKVVDAFASLNIGAGELDAFLGHGLATASPAEIIELREMFAAIRDGEATWADYEKKAQPKGKPGFVDPKNEPDNGKKTEPPKGDKKTRTAAAENKPAVPVEDRLDGREAEEAAQTSPPNVVPMAQGEPAQDTTGASAPATAAAGTPQAELEKQLTVGGIGLEHFMIWMIKTERHKEAAYTSWADIPTAVAETVLKDKRGLANCIKLKSAYTK